MFETEPDPDRTLVALARAAMARVNATEGAAVRDGEGRVYAAAPVNLPTLRLSALDLAVANAVSSGATTITAAVIATSKVDIWSTEELGYELVRSLSDTAPVHMVSPDGTVIAVLQADVDDDD